MKKIIKILTFFAEMIKIKLMVLYGFLKEDD